MTEQPSRVITISGEIKQENRYIKIGEISRCANKIVYKFIDRKKGKEVAWNQIQIDSGDVGKVKNEMDKYSNLSGEHTVSFYELCDISDPSCVVFTTELMVCSLRDFVLKAKGVSLGVIKDWCTQVLKGLQYLHNQEPPIIHRDILANNLFFDSKGKVKIGVLGFSTMALNEANNTLPGTGFMAPEYDDKEKLFSVKVDIWSFGMCIIELTTLGYPYSEFETVDLIRQNINMGIKPLALFKISDPKLFDFIWCCLDCNPDKRCSAEQLLNHPFIVEKDEDDHKTFVKLRDKVEVNQLAVQYGTTKEGWLAYALRNAALCNSDLENNSNPDNVPSTNNDEDVVLSEGNIIDYDEISFDPKGSFHKLKYNPTYRTLEKLHSLDSSEDFLLEGYSEDHQLEPLSEDHQLEPLSEDHQLEPLSEDQILDVNFSQLFSETKTVNSGLFTPKLSPLSPSREKKVNKKCDKLLEKNLIQYEKNAESPLLEKKLH